MSCDDIRPQLTAYLDGELDADRGSAVRGHLRGCSLCRDAARDEAAVRDGLRELPPLDPPASLWAGVQAQLAAAEVADAERPPWRHRLARIPRQIGHGLKWLVVPRSTSSRFALGGLVAAAAVVLAYWRTHSVDIEGPSLGEWARQVDGAIAAVQAPAPLPRATFDPHFADVTDDVAADDARANARYGDAADELYQQVHDVRAAWPADRRQLFDAHVAKMRGDVAAARQGKPRQRAQRELVRYLQSALVRDQVALNDRSFAGGAP